MVADENLFWAGWRKLESKVMNKLRKKLGFYQMLTFGVLLAGLILVVENRGARQEIRKKAQDGQWEIYYETDFNNLNGWEVRERGGEAKIVNGWARLKSSGKRYPVIGRWNGIENGSGSFIPTSGDFKIQIRFRYNRPQSVAGYGVSQWSSAWCENAGFDYNFKEFFGVTWHKSLGLELRLFKKTKKLTVDTKVHTLEVTKVGDNWKLKIDGQAKLTGVDPKKNKCPYPDSLRFGDPTIQGDAGVWPVLLVDWVKVYKKGVGPSPSPSGSPGPSGSPEPSPSGSPVPPSDGTTLNFKARFTGLEEDKQSLKTTLTAKNTGWEQSVVAQNDGAYSGLSLSGLTVGEAYDFILDAHPYLTAKKSLTIKEGVNPSSGYLDFGELKTGDLKPDNEINGIDWSLMKMYFGQSGEE